VEGGAEHGGRGVAQRGKEGRARTAMLVTAPVFQADKSPLKLEASRNIDCDGRLGASWGCRGGWRASCARSRTCATVVVAVVVAVVAVVMVVGVWRAWRERRGAAWQGRASTHVHARDLARVP
jgi:hypothetical protein